MTRADVQHQDVLNAIAEYDELGQAAFLDRYKMGKATSYLLRHDGRDYDSKAIFAAAHGQHPGLAPLSSDEFHGGANDAAKYLRRLGFEVYSTRGPTWVRDELILACDLVYRNDWKGIDDKDERVQALSQLLQKLPLHPQEARGPKFRNPNSVSRKTYDFATHHPDYQGTPTNGGAGDLVVLHEFLADGSRMSQVAEAIRDGVESGRLLDDVEVMQDVDDMDGEAPEGRLLERRVSAGDQRVLLHRGRAAVRQVLEDYLAEAAS